MKFGKRLKKEAQPEWLSAYLNYKMLKKQIKKIKEAKKSLLEKGSSLKICDVLGFGEGTFIFSMELTDQPEYQIVVKFEMEFFAKLESELAKLNKFCVTKEKEFGSCLDDCSYALGGLVTLIHGLTKRCRNILFWIHNFLK
jgi:SPX domain protein involved in polyphosphate accumulation